MRYWVMLPLVLANPLRAEATTTTNSHWISLDTQSPLKSEVMKTSKPLPSDLLILPWGNLETVQVQLLALETVPQPEGVLQATEAMAVEGSELV